MNRDSKILVSGDKANCTEGGLIAKLDPRCFRTTEVETLLGARSKAKQKLGQEKTTTVRELVAEMANADYTAERLDSLVKSAAFKAYGYNE